MKRSEANCCCIFPDITTTTTTTFLSLRSSFFWYEEKIWTEIAKYLDVRSIVMLSTTCKWFYKYLNEEGVWKYACLRDLGVPDPGTSVPFKWKKLYASAFDGSHSYLFHQKEKHKDWIRIGAFSLESSAAILTEKLIYPKEFQQKEITKDMLQTPGFCVLTNIKTGIWVADLHLLCCPVCDLDTCEGAMQTLDARQFELFMNEDYQRGTWFYAEISSHETKKHVDGASGAIFDLKHLRDASTAKVFDTKSWIGESDDLKPKSKVTPHAVAINTKLQQNEGVNVRFHIMRAGKDGQIVAFRISQHLI